MAAIGNLAASLDININKYATCVLSIAWTTNDSPPVPIDLSNATAMLQIRASTASANILYQATTNNARIKLHTLIGTITVTIPAADTGGFVFDNAVYDLVVKLNTGEVRRVLEGNVYVLPGVSVIVPPTP